MTTSMVDSLHGIEIRGHADGSGRRTAGDAEFCTNSYAKWNDHCPWPTPPCLLRFLQVADCVIQKPMPFRMPFSLRHQRPSSCRHANWRHSLMMQPSETMTERRLRLKIAVQN